MIQVPLRGIALIVASTLFFACSDVIAKFLAASLPAAEIAWMRYLSFTALVIPAVLWSGGAAAFRSRSPRLQVLRGLGMAGSALLFTAGLRYLPVAESTAIYFVSPILITALSIPFLGETVGWRRWSAALVGLLGVLIVIRPGTDAFEIASLFPLAGATCWAAAAIVTRKMSGDRPVTTLAYSALVGMAVTTVLVPFDFVTPTAGQVGLGLLFGVLSTAGHWLVVLAYRHASASLIAPFGYGQLIWAGALGYLAFGAMPDEMTVAGAVIIAASGLYTAYRERVRGSSAS